MGEGLECCQGLTEHVLEKGHGFRVHALMNGFGETSTGWHNWVACAANCANAVLASLQAPKVTRARKSLPVIFEVRWTMPVRRAVASLSSAAKKSVNMVTALRVQAGIEVSLVWPV
jgi:hypothetical protein